MKRFSLFAALFVFLFNFAALKGQIGVTTVSINTSPIDIQQTAVWCWAAAIQNVLKSHDIHVSQNEIVATTYGQVVELPLFNPWDAVINLFKHNQKIAPTGLVIHPFIIAGPPAPAVLIRELSREKSPIIVMYANPQGGGHVVVCCGAKFEGSPDSPIIREVWIKDPWDGQNKIWRGRDLADLWQHTIFVKVALKPKTFFFYNGLQYEVTPTYEIIDSLNRQITGRIWYFTEYQSWHIFDLWGNDLGPIP